MPVEGGGSDTAVDDGGGGGGGDTFLRSASHVAVGYPLPSCVSE